MSFFLSILLVSAQETLDAVHKIAAIEQDKFFGWPANNGIWQWGDEILVGFTRGNFLVQTSHNITGNQESLFARSLDGGETWKMFDPENFLDDENEKWLPKGKKYLENPLNFRDKGFAMRIFSTGYHGNDDPAGGFYYSYDRGTTWNGPYFLGEINNHEELKNMNITARTDYIVTGKKEMFIFISTVPKDGTLNRIACIQTVDGGMNFKFIAWITPPDDKGSAIMSSTIQMSKNKFILAYRKIYPELDNRKGNTIEMAVSEDGCQTWKFLSTVKIMEFHSNPPALLKLEDGRVICTYGDRYNGTISGKYSIDEGSTWGEEFVIRKGFKDMDSTYDFGYPRLAQRNDGKLVALYYWASPENLQQHIAASIWEDPKNKMRKK
jgi:hypothetical protein